MAVSAIWNSGAAAANPQLSAHPMSTTQQTTAGSGNEATISANDFLTLLVTEMKNQDPTAATDPNQYINQLVQVNSLEQLISINQNLSTALGSSAAGSGEVARNSREPVNNNANPDASDHPKAIAHYAQAVSDPARGGGETPAGAVSGNLSVPSTSRAAVRVGLALSGRN